MSYKLKSPVFDLILCISDAVDSISPQLADHHRRTAYLAYQLGRQFGLPVARCKELAIAAALHDIGATALKERLNLLNFDTKVSADHNAVYAAHNAVYATHNEVSAVHAEVGYLLISNYPAFALAAEIVRFHHVNWNDGAGKLNMGLSVPVESHILHLAERVAVQIDPRKEVLSQVRSITNRVKRKSGDDFMPEVVDAFLRLAEKDFIWFDMVSPSADIALWNDLDWDVISLEGAEFLELSRFFCRLVDFKSPFTATHSSRVAVCGQALAELSGFSMLDQRLISLCGYLHDIGKLCVPLEILDKPAALSTEESAVMRHHAYYTNHILKRIGVFENVRVWSSYHHERLDGSGYPYQLKGEELTTGSRIIAIADVFTAVSEDRPYRSARNDIDVMDVMNDMARKGLLDARLIKLLGSRVHEINALMAEAEFSASRDYHEFIDRRTRYMDFVRAGE